MYASLFFDLVKFCFKITYIEPSLLMWYIIINYTTLKTKEDIYEKESYLSTNFIFDVNTCNQRD